jgi:hypothetical protein
VICIIGHDVSICKSYVLFLAAQRKRKVRIDYAKELCRLWRPDLFVLQEYENGLETGRKGDQERKGRVERGLRLVKYTKKGVKEIFLLCRLICHGFTLRPCISYFKSHFHFFLECIQ